MSGVLWLHSSQVSSGYLGNTNTGLAGSDMLPSCPVKFPSQDYPLQNLTENWVAVGETFLAAGNFCSPLVTALALLWYYYVKEFGGRIFCVGILISQQRCSFTICTIIGWVIFHFLTIIVLQYCQWPGGMWSCLFVLCENNSRVLILMKIFECPLIWQTCHRNSLNPS